MNRILCIVLGAALAGSGCLNLTNAKKEPDPPPPVAPAPPPVVLPEQITDKNAFEKAKALKAELEHDANNFSAAGAD